ncbi:MAG: hypothetical protein HY903_16940 [Deltaproteobacteria bacterium]|nr:hypothetical protein [Deltaproteobacteria bacterium]
MRRTLAISWTLLVTISLACEPATVDLLPPSDPAPPAAAPRGPAPITPPAAPLSEDDEPDVVAYATPVIKEARVVRRGPKAQIQLHFEKVKGASKYEIEVSKVLTFGRSAIAVAVSGPRFASRWIDPGVYFWRLRAVGPAGVGAYTNVQVLDATLTHTANAGRRAPRPAETVEAPLPPEPVVVEPAAKALALRLVWRRPDHQAIVTTNPLKVEGVATRGATVQVGDGTPVTVDASFTIAVPVVHGKNDLVLVARLGDQSKRLERTVYYADLTRLAPIRDRFEALKKQLAEIAAIRDELDQTVKSLESRLGKTPAQSAGMGDIKAEMDRITAIRKQIDAEVSKAIAELDRLFAGT